MDVRRVVTGHDDADKAILVSDEPVAPVTTPISPLTAFHQLWNDDAAPDFPDDGARPAPTTCFPPIGGFRFGFFTLAPDDAPRDLEGVDIGALGHRHPRARRRRGRRAAPG